MVKKKKTPLCDEAIMWLDCRPWTVSRKNTVVKIFDRRKNPQNVQGLALYLGVVLGLWLQRSLGIVPLRFNFTGSRCLPLGPYKGVCISSVDSGTHSGANYQGKKGGRYVEITVFQVGGAECSRTMLQQSYQKDSIFPDRRAVQKFAFEANVVSPTINRSSCFRWRNAMAVWCSQAGGDWWGANGCGGKLCKSW